MADFSGHGLTGLMSAGVSLAQGGALADGDTAAGFNGSSGYVRALHAAALDFASAMSVEAWVKSSGTGDWQRIVGKGTDGQNMNWELWLTDSGQVVWSVAGDATSSSVAMISTTGSVTDDAWHHIVATVDATAGQRLYVDGVEAASHEVATVLLTNSEPVWMGADPLYGGGYLNGAIDEVALYDHVLTPLQIAAHYALRSETLTTTGTGAATVVVAANATASSREATVSVAGVPVSVSQAAGSTTCAFSVAPTTINSGASGHVGSVAVTATLPSCTWTATSDSAWVEVHAPVGGYVGRVLADQSVGYWRLGETSGTTAGDRSGHGLAGTFAGGVTLAASSALADDDAAAQFDGSSAYVQVAADSTLNMASQLSVEAWVKTSGTGQWQRIVGKGTDGVNSVWELWLTDTGRIVWSITHDANNSSFGNVDSIVTINDGAWHHLVATLDTSGLQRVYVDGAVAGSRWAAPILLANNQPLTFGADVGYGAGYFGGALDEIAIYDHVLTPGDVAAHYALRTAAATAAGSGAVTYTVAPNTGSVRSATLTVAGNAVPLSQGGVTSTCTYTVTPSSVASPARGSAGLIGVATNNSACVWTPSATESWVSVVPVTGAYAQSVLADEPLGYWRLNESSGTVAGDASGHGHAGTYVGSVTLGDANGLADGSASAGFGGNGSVQIADGPVWNPPALEWNASTSTVEMWVNVPASSDAYQTLFAKGAWPPSPITVYLLPGTSEPLVYWRGIDGQSHYAMLATGIVGQGWTHLALTFTPTTYAFYVNGAPDTSGPLTSPLASSTEAITIAASEDAALHGHVSDVAIYGTALSAARVAAHYAARTVSGSTGSGLVSYAVAANPTTSARSAAVNVAGESVSVTQAPLPVCTATVTPASLTVGAGGQNGLLDVALSDPACEWTATSNQPWARLAPVRGAYVGAVLADAPTGYWRLNDATGASVAVDASGHGRDATYGGTVTLGAVNGLLDGSTAASFAGAGTVTIPHVSAWDSQTISVEAWVNVPNLPGQYQTLFTKGEWPNSPITVYLQPGETKPLVYWRDTDGQHRFKVLTSGVVGPGWTHLVLAFTSTGYEFYVNGALDSSGELPAPLTTSGDPITLASGDDAWLRGSLSDVAIYATALTGSQVAAHYAERLSIGGAGSGKISYAIAANTGTTRTATLTVAGQNVSVTQTGSSTNCTFDVSPAGVQRFASPAWGMFTVATGAGCAWTPTTTDDWISVTPPADPNGVLVGFSLTANTGGSARTGTITVGSATFTIVQNGEACAASVSPTSISTDTAGTSGNLTTTTSWGCGGALASNRPWVRVTPPSAGYAGQVLADAPTGYWRLGDLSGTTTVDASGHGFDGLYAGAFTLGTPASISDGNTAVTFSGGDALWDYRWELDPGGSSFTVEAWIQTTTTLTGVIAGSWQDDLGYGLTMNAGKAEFRADYYGPTYLLQSTQAINDGLWHHVVGAYNASTAEATLYIDGVVDGVVSDAGGAWGWAGFTIGSGPDGTTAALSAAIDEVAFWHTALSAERVAAHYAAQHEPLVGSGVLSASIPYVVDANPFGATRTGEISIGTVTVPVSQTGISCGPFSVTPTSIPSPSGGMGGGIAVTATPECTWSASSNSAWVTLQGPLGGYAGQVLADGATGYWRLDDTETTAAADSSGFGSDGYIRRQLHTGHRGTDRRQCGGGVRGRQCSRQHPERAH